MGDILIGKGNEQIFLHGRYGNRHGLVAGATGTGKTITLLVIAEGFSRLGVPVVIGDAKGDVAGLALPGTPHQRIEERVQQIGIPDYQQGASPVVFWDLWGEQGHPVRTTITEIGPTLLARMLELNDTQEGVLNVAFRVADEAGLLLLDLKDLRALLNHLAEKRQEVSAQYGLVNSASIRSRSPVGARYDTPVDRESAYEILARHAEEAAAAAARDAEQAAQAKEAEAAQRAAARARPRPSSRQGVGEAMVKSTVRTIGNTIGRELARGLMGSLFGGKKR